MVFFEIVPDCRGAYIGRETGGESNPSTVL